MSSIGSNNFIRMSGPQVPALAIAMATINRKGRDGEVFRSDARKVPEVIQRTVTYVTSAGDANSADDVYKALIGSLVTVVDDHGRSVSNVMVLGAQVDFIQAVTTATATASHLVYGSWLLKPTG